MSRAAGPSDQAAALIDRLPKAELHIHIEGSLEPEMMAALAARNGVRLGNSSIEAIRAAYRFDGLQDFLDIYYQGMSVLVRRVDFYDLMMAYLRRAAADGITRCEIFFDPQGHLPRGVGFDTMLDGLTSAIADASAELPLTADLILCFLRHLSEDDALRTLDLALPHASHIIGVGLDSSENGHPPVKFKTVFRRAREAGFRLVAHAGEEGPPDYVWQALDELGVDRIDHGNRALEDPELVRRIARDQIPLTVCPLSNLRLKGVSDLAGHPIRRMLDAGLMATVNSDDPAYFGGYLNANLHALGLGEQEIITVLRNSFRASFLDPSAKAEAEAAFARAQTPSPSV